MLVKSEPEDFSLSMAAITEMETAMFQKELFETGFSGESYNCLSCYNYNIIID